MMYKKPIRLSIFNKLFVSFLAVSVLSQLLLFGVSYFKFIHTFEQKTIDANYEVLKLVVGKVQTLMTQVEQISYTVFQKDVQALLARADTTDKLENLRIQIELEAIFQQKINFYNMLSVIKGITIVDKSGEVYYSNAGVIDGSYDFQAQDWFRRISAEETNFEIVGPHKQSYLKQSAWPSSEERVDLKDLSLSYVRQIGNIQYANQHYGVLIIDLDMVALDAILRPLKAGDAGEIFIADELGRVKYSTNSNSIGMVRNQSDFQSKFDQPAGYFPSRLDGRQILVTYVSNDLYDWNVVSINRTDDLFAEANDIRNMTIIMTVFSLLLAILLSFTLSSRMVKPIRKLRTAMSKAGSGFFHIRIPVQSQDEIGDLTDGFNKMMRLIQQLIEEVYEKELKQREAQMNALQTQINPHFLYNTFETVSSIAQVHGVEVISDISKSMSAMFRYSTKYGSRLVTISEEIAHIHHYIRIIKVRFGNKFNFSVNMTEDIASRKILKFVLQPLVENAVFHGIELKPGQSELVISARMDEKAIYISVRDNGLGMTEDELEEVRNMLKNPGIVQDRAGKSGGVGVKNVHDRIRLYFGEPYGLTLTSKKDHGTEAVLTVPVETQK